ncbi:DNA repair protein RadA [candidate division WWE3 bacterium CG08_land_8_20_14_0_20_41_10]|uniref:DNA repair protein RadA n=1 Tax=candidate division WWE3 bacterium CG08_land_8_20_14_0_20_41_10 TaxID=1975085 RepID=A0A2H0XAN1_UNCKA|nr:MAG: DNA repair protein RadA [candidate division WWE3 bacterium CG08_land_8_20_14_0_20_41_10]
MKNLKTVYICQSCSGQVTNWAGQCPKCGEWNTLVETLDRSGGNKASGKKASNDGVSAGFTASVKVETLDKVKISDTQRILTGVGEFDRVLGGGFVPGQAVLLAGEPGIGKSTLITQVCKSLHTKSILYMCGEESPAQIKLRATRMGYAGDNLNALQETDVDVVEQVLYSNSENTQNGQKCKYDLLVIDSIQTLYTKDLVSSAGSVAQIKECSQRLVRVAKNMNLCVILVGHVTKEGEIAGPKVLEHIVDTVLYMEGDSQHLYRILRTTKNRFGAVSEVGMFEMVENGIKEVTNPSELFVSKDNASMIGSCIAVAMEGFRPILYEIQALSVKTNFGYPKRTASGFNLNRLQVLLAVLEKRCKIPCYQYDIYLNIAGGFKVNDSASDLAVCLAVASSILEKPLKQGTAVFGEVGLMGEVRAVPHAQKRTQEAKRLGYKADFVPKFVFDYIKQLL